MGQPRRRRRGGERLSFSRFSYRSIQCAELWDKCDGGLSLASGLQAASWLSLILCAIWTIDQPLRQFANMQLSRLLVLVIVAPWTCAFALWPFTTVPAAEPVPAVPKSVAGCKAVYKGAKSRERSQCIKRVEHKKWRLLEQQDINASIYCDDLCESGQYQIYNGLEMGPEVADECMENCKRDELGEAYGELERYREHHKRTIGLYFNPFKMYKNAGSGTFAGGAIWFGLLAALCYYLRESVVGPPPCSTFKHQVRNILQLAVNLFALLAGFCVTAFGARLCMV